MVGPTLATNLVSTGLIAWKAWERRVEVKKHLGEASRCVRTERVFALLVESGFIIAAFGYVLPPEVSMLAEGFTALFQIVYLISAFDLIPVLGFTVMDSVLLFVSGLYPTLIIILVAMQKSPVQHYSTHSTVMQFTREAAPEPLRAGDTPPYVYTIFRENANDTDKRVHSVMETSDEERSQ
ncbi:hypothetical protein EDB85DRAFT_1888561 [Lactarius pseudohatsudake]|nr:hypothetical protein EDB85DRAFT_1888561 [Lactarius pseudohatsudake]